MSEQILIQLLKEVRHLQADVTSLRDAIEGRPDNAKCYSFKEFADILNVKSTTLYTRLAQGFYPWARKEGKKWLFPSCQVKRYIMSDSSDEAQSSI